VFVVEDEPMISMLVMSMLEELACSVAAEASDIEAATEFAQTVDFDLAILDVNLKGKTVFPVAEFIKARGLPIIFATGYGSEGVPEAFRNFPTLAKPFQIEALAKAIDELFRSRKL
jgi:CheY-like chemotaxis protein